MGKPDDPQIQPHAGIKKAQVLGFLVYFCESYRGFLHLPYCAVHARKYTRMKAA